MKRNSAVWILRVVSFLFAVGVGVFIFFSSSDDAPTSSEKSREVAEVLAPVIVTDYRSMTPSQKRASVGSLTGVLRKCAHALEYMAFGTFVSLFSFTFSAGPQKKRRAPASGAILAASLAFCFVFAALDEWHQTFVSGRSGEWNDIILDFFRGVLLHPDRLGGVRDRGKPQSKKSGGAAQSGRIKELSGNPVIRSRFPNSSFCFQRVSSHRKVLGSPTLSSPRKSHCRSTS